jgi:ABC-2 type transport system ATP-binding protein
MSSGVVCDRVSFRYGRRPALREVSLELAHGITGLLGPNGAGKSTLLALLATLTVPHEGTVRVFGHDTARRRGREAARRRIGVLPQRFSLVPSMTVLDTVAYAAWMNGIDSRRCRERAEAVLCEVELVDHLSRRVRSLSGGQRQRIGIAAALVHDPELLVLDEPTVGLDPVVRVQLRRLLHRLATGRVVMLSTHMVEDVVQLCTRVAVLDAGRLVYDGATAELAEASNATGAGAGLASPLELAYERLLARPALGSEP